MKKTFLLFVISLLLLAVNSFGQNNHSFTQRPHVDFAGEWLLNKGKSAPIPFDKWSITTMKDSFVVIMYPSKDHPTLADPVTQQFNYTGTETVNFSPRLQQEVRSTVSWRDKTMLISNSVGDRQEWNLSGDGKILTIAFTHSGGDTATCVFDKTK